MKTVRIKLEHHWDNHTKKKSLSACGAKNHIFSRFQVGGISKLALQRIPLKGFWTAFLDHILSLRIPQLRSGRDHRNARNPMKTNVKTHVNMYISIKSKNNVSFWRKNMSRNVSDLTGKTCTFGNFLRIILTKLERKLGDHTKKKSPSTKYAQNTNISRNQVGGV